MPNNLKARPMDAIIQEFASKGFGPATIRFMQDLAERNDKTLTNLGLLQNQAVDFTQPYTNKNQDNVPDGSAFLRSPQFAGALNMAENGNFEAAATLPPPGWSAILATLSYETAAPQEGLRSLIIMASAQFGGAIATRKYLARPGDVFKIAGQIFQANLAQKGTIVLLFLDKNGAQIGTVDTGANNGGVATWTPVQMTGVAPANTSSAQLKVQSEAVGGGICKFDSIVCTRLATAFELTPINTAGTPRSTTGLLTQHAAGSTQVDVTSSTWQFGDGIVAYNTGSFDPGILQTSYATGDDPGYGGGGIPYIPRTTPADANAANGRLFFGKIITAAGTATSVGGGSGGGGPISKAALA